MEARLLNLPDALNLASLLSKYVDTVSITPELSALDFIGSIVDKIEPIDYLNILKLFTDEPLVKLEKSDGVNLLKLLFSGLEKNRILSLLDAHKNLGFA